MALKGCDTEEHNVPKPTGNFKKETCTKALKICFSSHSVSCIIHYRKTGQQFKQWKEIGEEYR